MKLDPFDIFAPLAIALIFLLLGWISDRTITGGGPLTSHMRKVLFYGFFLVLGMVYSMAATAMFGWPRPVWIILTVMWALMLASVAWRRSRKASPLRLSSSKSIADLFAEVFPTLGLVICLIGSAMEWEYIFEGRGHWFVGLLWLAGITGAILIARRNRRATVIIGLRGFVGLLAVGAIAQRSYPGFIVAAIFGLLLFLLEKFWKDGTNKRESGEEGLDPLVSGSDAAHSTKLP